MAARAEVTTEITDLSHRLNNTTDRPMNGSFRSTFAELNDVSEQLTFEEFVMHLSTRFVQLRDSQIEAHFSESLARLGRFLNVDRVVLSEPTEDRSTLRAEHSWARKSVNPIPAGWCWSDKIPYALRTIREGRVFQFSRFEDLPPEAASDRESFQATDDEAHLSVPLQVAESPLGALTLACVGRSRTWTEQLVQRVRFIAEIFANALARKEATLRLRSTTTRVRELEEHVEEGKPNLREEFEKSHETEGIVGQSAAVGHMLRQVAHVAPTDATVLILGETGTGKELVARAVHRQSLRRDRALVKVNCAALPATLVESELFGHERGAFTGALKERVGRFQLADGGTIFLDEIGDLPLELQAKLLRVLQEGEFERLGSSETRTVDVRVIAATNRALKRAVDEGAFRADLYYRLRVVPIEIAPLRHRRDDIPLLVWSFIQKFQGHTGKRFERISSRVMDALVNYAWPGNVRELENVIQRAVVLSPDTTLVVSEDFTSEAKFETRPGENLSAMERNHIMDVLEKCHWKVKGVGNAAELLGLNPSTLRGRMRKLGINRAK